MKRALSEGRTLAADHAIDPMEIGGETFINVSNNAPTLRAVIDNYLRNLGLDITPDHEVDNLAMAMSLVASTRGIALLPAYANFLRWSVIGLPLKGEAPAIALVIGYCAANTSPILRLSLSKAGRYGRFAGMKSLDAFERQH